MSQLDWDQVLETHGGRSEEEEVEVEEPQHPRRCLEAGYPGPQHLPALWQREDPAHGLPVVRLVQEPRRHRRLLIHVCTSVLVAGAADRLWPSSAGGE